MKPVVGTAIYTVKDGQTSLGMAYGAPWSNDYKLVVYTNAGYGVAGQHGIYHTVMLGDRSVFTVIFGLHTDYDDAFLGPYTFKDTP